MINWGIIGCGKVTELKSGPAFNKIENSRLVAVMRRNRELAEDYARRHGVPKVYSSADALIADSEVNAVYIATPPGSHREYALKVLQAGKPVYIEKPMALNYRECEEINEASARYKLPVYVAYYRRTLPGFLKIKNLIESGEIGKPRFVVFHIFNYQSDDEKAGRLPWRVLPEISGAGHFFDLASHQLDYLDFLFGPVREISSLAINQGGLYKAEDFVSASFLFDNNIAGTGIWSFSSPREANRDTFEIIGEKGLIKTSTFTYDPIIVINSEGTREYVNERPDNIQFYLIEQIVKALSGGPDTVVSTGITAARTSRVMDEVVKKYYETHDIRK
ncbi:MAG TPA: Gfo/Idh/MocA family oxidoreductase [Bacteroidales bacterium]|jgi:predicted dehydrogenase|nr:Gfo/Idh/MocA family oxidoreductase [Bacteroidales bacterium]